MRTAQLLPFVAAGLLTLGSACKKEEIIKEVEKPEVWHANPHLRGQQRLILNAISDGSKLYLQQPAFLAILTGSGREQLQSYVPGVLPSDAFNRQPLHPNWLYGQLSNGTVLVFRSMQFPVGDGPSITVQAVDPEGVAFDGASDATRLRAAFATDGTLLIPYRRTNQEARLALIHPASSLPGEMHLSATTVALPGGVGNRVSGIWSMGEYFLVSYNGRIARVTPDGQFNEQDFTNLFISSVVPAADAVYAIMNDGYVLRSVDEGRSWVTTRFENLRFDVAAARYQWVGDSLVGAYQDQLFTLRISPDGSSWRWRALHTDEMASTVINAVHVLHDTVYAATTGGLYTRPLNRFYANRPE